VGGISIGSIGLILRGRRIYGVAVDELCSSSSSLGTIIAVLSSALILLLFKMLLLERLR
jgi:hypothetical protein